LERRGLYPTRKYLQGLVKQICEEIPEMEITRSTQSYHFTYTGKVGVKREALGIYEATRAYIYFRGSTYPVSLKRLEELKTLAAFIVIIEKEGVVELLTHWADLYGVALCYTKGFLTDNAKELSRLADESGCRIVILTDMDFAGRAMAYLVPNIPRIGITLQTLKRLGLELNTDILEELPQPKVKNPKKHRVLTYLNNTHASTAKLKYEQGLISKEDWKIMSGGKYGRRIEIDNVLAAAGA
jgi:5S rRNA maturation endonuclease (ribonuclease M5)